MPSKFKQPNRFRRWGESPSVAMRIGLSTALVVVSFLSPGASAGDSVVVFNEIHYHPPGEESSLEWVEFHNQMASDVDMSAWRIDGGIQFDFALGTVVPGGGYLVVARDPQALQAATGFSEALGPFTGALDNGGEEIVLYNHNRLQPNPELEGRRVMNRLEYGDNHPWPSAPDGSGATLAKRDPDTGTGQQENWTWSAQVGGTPAAENFPSPDDVPPEIVHVLEAAAVWRYSEAGEDFDATWARSAHPLGGNWLQGPGALGFETIANDLFATTLSRPALRAVVTHYFETELELNPETIQRLAHVNIEHLIDDGAVFYLNGEEVHRYNMPDGAVDSETLASGGLEATWIAASQLSAANLVAGANRISVEVHQVSAGSSDVAFGLTLDLALGPPPAAGGDLSGLVLNEIGPADEQTPLSVELLNTGLSPISLEGVVLSVSGDAGREIVLPAGTSLEAGQFLVLEESIPFTDRDRFFLFSPDRRRVIDARQASASLRGSVPNGEFEGRWLRPDKATTGGENTFTLQEAVAINEIFYHAYPEGGSADIPPELGNSVLVPVASEWRFFENVTGEGLPADWALGAHPAWPSGAGLLGRETSALEEPIRTALSFSRPQVTYYFETEFDFSGAIGSGLVIRHLIDDGAVFYLNGEEIGRFNMLAGTVVPGTLATPSVGNAESVTQAFPNARPVEGRNRLSVEVHQSNLGSSDVVFGAEVLGKSVVRPGIPGKPFVEPGEEWIELFNRSAEPADLSGWRLEEGVEFEFPDGTVLEPGGYLVIADDAEALRAKYPQITIAGTFGGGLSNRGEVVRLSDSAGNPADEVHYHDSGRWHAFADGGGSSLELRDAGADNRVPENWAASDESGASLWRNYTYRGVAGNDRQGNNVFHEFLLGLLDAGEILLDDVSVVEDPDGAALEFIQNGDFEGAAIGSLANKWRAVGTHGSHGRTVVVADPDNPANRCLHVVATDNTEDKHNKIETTYRDRERVAVGTDYQISFRAKWLRGSNQVNTRLYFNFLQKTTRLPVPESWGTPGGANSTRVENMGPSFSGLSHEPAVPAADQPVAVNIVAEDPDGIASVDLIYGIDGNNFIKMAMAETSDGAYATVIPGQSARRIVQFYVEAVDGKGGVSHFPAGGSDSRALFKVDDGRARLGEVHNLRVVMLNSERTFLFRNTNRMSNDRIGATVIYDESEVFHNVGVRLKGSAAGRYGSNGYGFNIEFDPEHLFRGVHRTLSIERTPPLRDVFAKHLLTQAGGPGLGAYDDAGRIIAPTEGDSGPCLFAMARHTAEYWEGLFGNNSDQGTLFNQELLYNPNAASGGAEGLKINNPYNHNGGRYDFVDRGDDKEPYRFGFQIRSQRERDDYSAIIGASKALSLSGQEMEEAASEFIDVDQWARGFAAMSLVGTSDTYTRVWEHNVRYYARPTDGKLIVLPWDLDSAFRLTPTTVPIGGNAAGKLLKRPLVQRLFYAHALDMIETTFNDDYAGPWGDHLGSLTGTRYRSEASFVRSRANFISGRLPDEVPFEITTNGGDAVSVNTSSASLQGSGWINVRFIRRPDGTAYALRWIDDETWEITATLQAGDNEVILEAFDMRGNPVGSDSVQVTTSATASAPSALNVAITEIHYHPSDPIETEIAAGFTDAERFEFLELTNTGDTAVDFSRSRFIDGIAFEFPASFSPVEPGGRVVLVANEAAFRLRYGETAVVVGEYTGSLRNSGERLRFEDAAGAGVLEFSYDDRHPWPESPDGSGPSLVLIAPETAPDHANPLNWRSSSPPDANPGTTDRIPFDDLIDTLPGYALVDAPAEPSLIEFDGMVAVAFTRMLGTDVAEVTVEYSSDLKSWFTAELEDFVGRTDDQAGATTLYYRIPENRKAHFARLRLRRR